MPSNGKTRPQDHYEVLHLSRSGDSRQLSKEEVKAAYHRALLTHHPDKARHNPTNNVGSEQSTAKPKFTVDQIVTAYQVLSDPSRRVEFNEQLIKSERLQPTQKNEGKATHIGVETFDLDDLDHDEVNSTWFRGCRCGSEESYVLNEDDLEKESHSGEIYVGCKGCSLFIRVLFGVDEG